MSSSLVPQEISPVLYTLFYMLVEGPLLTDFESCFIGYRHESRVLSN